MQRMYSPVALVVDDDPVLTNRMIRGFLSETSLGVLEATDLATAYAYIRDPKLKIDVVITDLGFVDATRDKANNLSDGLDFIEKVAIYRPDSESYVLSINAEDDAFQDRANERNLSIVEWFPKLGGPSKPWRKVELNCLIKALKRNAGFREQAREMGIDVRDYATDELIAEQFRDAIVLPRITYLPTLSEEYEILKPIEVLCIPEGKDGFRASAPYIGLITEGTGESVREAVDNLTELIIQEIELFDSEVIEPVGYAAHVRDMLRTFVRTVDATSDNPSLSQDTNV